VLLKVKQPYENHNGGALAFGPDGYLYIALGDGGSGGDPENHAQNKNDFLGKILRIDINKGDPYGVPADNPFAAEAGTKPEIWAWGLRNPWKMSFDRKTGDFWIADVGQNKIEEVNMQKKSSKGGENYGWRCYEGTQTYNTDGCKDASTYVGPVFEYAQEGGDRCSVTGGYQYRGTDNPDLVGSYIYGDFCSGEILSATEQDGKWTQTVVLKTPYKISTFGQDNDNELYVSDLASGSIYRLSTH
jgi:glucose/arabinose dehydrogenase